MLREGNSDRRVAAPVKEDAQRNPHKLKPWAAAAECKTEVAHMSADDFYGNEKSVAVASPTTVRIELVDGDDVTVLKPRTALQAGEVIDGSVMRVASLREFFEKEITDCKEKGAPVPCSPTCPQPPPLPPTCHPLPQRRLFGALLQSAQVPARNEICL